MLMAFFLFSSLQSTGYCESSWRSCLFVCLVLYFPSVLSSISFLSLIGSTCYLYAPKYLHPMTHIFNICAVIINLYTFRRFLSILLPFTTLIKWLWNLFLLLIPFSALKVLILYQLIILFALLSPKTFRVSKSKYSS